ncbi:MAG: tetratricopeptide repeat protein [Deltaproteobacteria bacterium]|nr:tetratricopeptide repeat protein [Deltaproteobacteria bacterium]
MKLVSTTLTGSCEDIIGDALRSVVEWVDACLVIDTGVTDKTLQVARSVAGDKYVERKFAWISDFAAARNFALDAAHEWGADWAITVDTDERIDLRGELIHAEIEAATEGVLMVTDETNAYSKERLFRLPAKARFSGPTHESFPSYKVGSRVLEKARFIELPKKPDALRAKFERDAKILGKHTKANPKDPRWFYYLGDALQNLGRFEEAIAAYKSCADLRGWNEESAWACFRAAECFIQLKRFNDAVEVCATGLSRHAGIAELAWLAGFASWQAGRPDQAAFWARLAIPMGLFRGRGQDAKRIGFRNVSALYEGPYDVLRFALRAMGDTAGADEAERLYQEAIRARSQG